MIRRCREGLNRLSLARSRNHSPRILLYSLQFNDSTQNVTLTSQPISVKNEEHASEGIRT